MWRAAAKCRPGLPACRALQHCHGASCEAHLKRRDVSADTPGCGSVVGSGDVELFPLQVIGAGVELVQAAGRAERGAGAAAGDRDVDRGRDRVDEAGFAGFPAGEGIAEQLMKTLSRYGFYEGRSTALYDECAGAARMAVCGRSAGENRGVLWAGPAVRR
jgi:hypothetical protein